MFFSTLLRKPNQLTTFGSKPPCLRYLEVCEGFSHACTTCEHLGRNICGSLWGPFCTPEVELVTNPLPVWRHRCAAKPMDDNARASRYTIDMSSVERIFEEAVQLPEDQRLSLAYRLLVFNEPPVTEKVEQEWDSVIRERIRRYDEGEARSRPAADVFSALDRRLTRSPSNFWRRLNMS